MAVTANVTCSIQTARAASLDPGLALLGLPLISISQSTTDNQGISIELRQLCQRCVATVDYAQIEQRFADGAGSDIESDLGSVGFDYRLTPTSSINLITAMKIRVLVLRLRMTSFRKTGRWATANSLQES